MIRLLIVCYLCISANAATWYAAPSATAGNGSFTNPWSLFSSLAESGTIQPGDFLDLRGGNYLGQGFVSTLTGASTNYITVRSYPGEWAVVTDGRRGVLGTDMNDSDTNALNVVISGLSQFPSCCPPLFMIGSETLYIVGQPGTNYNLVRGWNGSAITTHTAGDSVRVVMDIIKHDGDYVTFRDFEITSLDATNRTAGISNHIGCGLHLSPLGHGNKAVNLVVHNVGHPGIGFWQQGAGGEINGCLIWGTGQYDWSASFGGAPRGSGVYSQNEGGMATIKNIISFRNFTSAAKVFGESGPVKDFQFVSNIVFQGSLEGSSGSSITSNLWWNGNVMLGSPFLAYQSTGNKAQYVINNTIVLGTLATKEQAESVYTNNTIFTPLGAGAGSIPFYYQSTLISTNDLTIDWDRNAYYLRTGSSPSQWGFISSEGTALNSAGGGILDYQNDLGKAWKNWSGFDSNSTFAESWPTDYLTVTVQANDYDTNRWHIAVVSTTGTNTAHLNLSAYGFTTGQRYQVIDAQNWPVVIARGNYSGGTISLPLTRTNVSTIPGVTHFANEHTNVDEPGLFNAFVLTSLGPTTINATTLNIGVP